MIRYLPKPHNLVLQWHITERCNWHCRHCYQEGDHTKEELNTQQLFDTLDQYMHMIKKYGLPKQRAMLNITGGEPFVREDFFEFIERVGGHSDMYRWGILSNGSFLNKNVVKKLKSLNIHHYQVSLEGAEKANDSIRGKDSFKKVVKYIKLLVDGCVETAVSLTLTKDNVKDIPSLVELLDSLGVSRLGTRRLIPYGRGSVLSSGLLEPEELKEYYISIQKINSKLKSKNSKLSVSIGCESGIFNDQILHRRKHYCGVIEGRILIVMSNGDVLPCRRLPIVVGNVLKQTLFEIYYSCNKLWELRNLNNAHPFCQKCSNFYQCFGGAKCVTYCYSNKLFIPDVQCWKFYKKIEPPAFFNKFQEIIKKDLRLNHSLTCQAYQY